MEDLRESDRPIRVRWSVALLGVAVVLISGHAQTIFYDGLGVGAIRPIAILLIALGIVSGLLGLIVVAPLLRHPERTDSPRPIVLSALCGLGVVAAAALMTLPFAALVILVVVAATQLRFVARGAPVPSPASRLRLALPYSIAVLVILPVGVLHVLAGNPAGTWMIIVWAVIGGAAAVAFPVLCRREIPALAGPPRRTVCAGLLLVAIVGYGHWLTGLGLAGATTPGGTIVAIVAQLATVLALVIGAPAWKRATVGT
ncbi:hypothetical protein [Microlunatus parietis]|uniref:Uncharacterized protein n=1 Tax=Microlunatus parietis TaxID=682979 RepID=A0A7Y9IAB8_9ACTN|nr:hypothetical protein [Microlunatus parietis]NYE73057.1 hypothetical protein [Microlunatus parietis]